MPGTQSIVGLQSGLDTTTLVDNLIAIGRANAVVLEAQREEKTNIITALKALEAKVLALKTQAAILNRDSTYEEATVTVSDKTVLTTSTSGQPASGQYDVQVLSLARNHQIASQGFSSQDESIFGTGTIEITVGGTTHSLDIDHTNNTLIGIKNVINDAGLDVSATIINDGSASNSYRLVISGDLTGRENEISVSSSLTGGLNLNYDSASFDDAETLISATGSSSAISLGASASFTADEHKTYTFTVQGSGEQTIGSGTITINWTDGTNSGSFDVTAADTEVELTGDGSEGLWLSFGAGILTSGDKFEISTFAPTLQEATDARIALGSSGGSGSPITVTSTTNTISDVIDGITLNLKKETEDGESISINSSVNLEAIKTKIRNFIDAYNEVISFIDDQNKYDEDNGVSGILFTDTNTWLMQSKLRSAVGRAVTGLDGQYQQLYSIGIRSDIEGELRMMDSSRLEDAINNDLDGLKRLFQAGGDSTNSMIEFISMGRQTKAGYGYMVDITQAAEQGTFTGTTLDPAGEGVTIDVNNEQLVLVIDGVTSSNMTLTRATYNSGAALAAELQDQIDADGIIGSKGIVVEWVDDDGQGYLKLTNGSYGESSTIEVVTTTSRDASVSLGLANGTATDGLDVAGTINGEPAEGKGQYLTGMEGNEYTDGLELLVSLTASHLASADSPDFITPTRGIVAQMSDLLESLTLAVDGTFARQVSGYQKQIETLDGRIEDIDARLEIRRQSLLEQFYQMEVALGQLDSERSFLDSQLDSINMNWMHYSK